MKSEELYVIESISYLCNLIILILLRPSYPFPIKITVYINNANWNTYSQTSYELSFNTYSKVEMTKGCSVFNFIMIKMACSQIALDYFQGSEDLLPVVLRYYLY